MVAIMVLVMIVGTAMDMTPTILILTPVLMPVVKAAGIDPVYFGVLFIINNAIGLITPPVGVVLNVVAGVGKIRMDAVTRGVVPFMIARVRRHVPDGAVPVAGDGAGALVLLTAAGGRIRPPAATPWGPWNSALTRGRQHGRVARPAKARPGRATTGGHRSRWNRKTQETTDARSDSRPAARPGAAGAGDSRPGRGAGADHAARRRAVQRRPRVQQVAASSSRSWSRSTTASRSTSCCTATASSAWRRTTSPT